MRTRWKQMFFGLALGIAAMILLLPVGFMVLHSFEDKSVLQALSQGTARFRWLPERGTIQNYVELLLLTPDYLMKFWNSLLIVGSITVGQVVVAAMGGYGLAKFHFRGQHLLLGVIMILMLMPHQVTLVPNYLMLDRMGLIGSRWALILPGIFSTFGVFLLSQAFAGIPGEMLDAARIDGAGEWCIFREIVLPCGKTGIAAVGVLTFVDQWNMVEQPLVFLKDVEQYPLSVFLAQIRPEALHVAFACGVLVMLPVTLLLLTCKDALEQGIQYAGLQSGGAG